MGDDKKIIFPLINTDARYLIREGTKVVFSSWVRVKRGNKRYLVYNESVSMFAIEIDTVRAVESMALALRDFTRQCLMCKYLYSIGGKIARASHVRANGQPGVEKDISDLSDKETFLFYTPKPFR